MSLAKITADASVPLDTWQLARVYDVMARPETTACTNEIDAHVFSGDGLCLFEGDERLDMSPAFERFLARYMVPVLREAREQYDALGVMVWGTRRAPGGVGPSSLAPFTPARGSFTVRSRLDDGLQTYAFAWRDERTLAVDRSMVVEHGFGFDPLPDGRLNSRAARLIDAYRLMDETTANKREADAERAAPTIATEYNFQADERQPSYENHDESAAHVDARTAHVVSTYAQRSGLDVRDVFAPAVVQALHRPRDTYMSAARAPLPRNARLVFRPSEKPVTNLRAAAPPDAFLDQHARLQQIVCSVLGVPQVALRSSHTVKTRAEAELAEADTARAAGAYARVLSTVATHIYDRLFSEYDTLQWFEERVGRRRRRPTQSLRELVTEADALAFENRPRRTLRLVMRPALALETATTLRAEGVIDDGEFVTAMRSRYGFPARRI